MFKNLKLGAKVGGGFGAVIILMLVVGVVGYVNLKSSNDGFTRYRETALDNVLAGRIQANLLTARMDVKNYVANRSLEARQEFDRRFDMLEGFVAEAKRTILEPERLEKVERTDRLIREYRDGFDQLVAALEVRDRILHEVLTVKGETMRENLSEVMQTANRDNDVEAAYRAGRAMESLLFSRLYAQKFFDTATEEQANITKEGLRAFQERLAELDDAIQNRTRQRLVDESTELAREYVASFAEVVDEVLMANDLIENTLDRIGPEVADLVEEVKLNIKAEQDEIGPRVQKRTDQAVVVILIVGIGALLLGIFLAVAISRMIVTPIVGVVEAAKEIADGDLSMELEVKSKDETGQLTEAFVNMLHSLRDKMQGVQALSRGDMNHQITVQTEKDELGKAMVAMRKNIENLVSEVASLVDSALDGDLKKRGEVEKFKGEYRKIVGGINDLLNAMSKPIQEASVSLEHMAENDFTHTMRGDYKGDFALIRDSVNATIEAMNETLGNVANSASQTSAGAGQVSESSQSLSQGATEQASSLEEVASAITELDSQTKTNSESADQANVIAREAHTNAMRGNERMNKMLEAMRGIESSSSEISKIIKVIDEIAFQTNLLALNAAVEAARAGEHGKGFAVVADEVRNLAQRSAEAARETTELIETSVKNSHEGGQVAEETAKALDDIVNGVTKVTDLVGEIAAASKEQSSAIGEVNEAIGQIDQVTQANSANAEETASAAEELSSQAQMLEQLVSRFRLLQARQGAVSGTGLKTPALPGSGSGASTKPARERRSESSGGKSKTNEKGSEVIPESVIDLEDDDFGQF